MVISIVAMDSLLAENNISRVSNVPQNTSYGQNYVKLMESLSQYSHIKYAAYRTALKLLKIQSTLNFGKVMLYDVVASFNVMNLKASENQDSIDKNTLSRIVSTILMRSNQTDSLSTKDMIIGLIQNTYDSKQKGFIDLLSCKTFIVILCQGELEAKVEYLFSQIRNHNNCISKRHLAHLLKAFAQIAEVLSEHSRFGIHMLPATVDSCFKDVSHLGVTQNQFVEWILKEPETLVWWMTMFRLKFVESVTHSVGCDGCGKKSFDGLLFECMKCSTYYQCQDCFLTAVVTSKHLLSHPMQEHCRPITLRRRNSLLRSVRKFFKRKKLATREYLPVDINATPTQTLESLLGETTGELFQISHDAVDGLFACRTVCQSQDDLEDVSVLNDKVCVVGSPDLSHTSIESAVSEVATLLTLLKSAQESQVDESFGDSLVELKNVIKKIKNALIVPQKPKNPFGHLLSGPLESTPIGLEWNARHRLRDNVKESSINDNAENHMVESSLFRMKETSLATLSSIYSDAETHGSLLDDTSYYTKENEFEEVNSCDLTPLATDDFIGFFPESISQKVWNEIAQCEPLKDSLYALYEELDNVQPHCKHIDTSSTGLMDEIQSALSEFNIPRLCRTESTQL